MTQLTFDIFSQQLVTHVISLGPRCATAYNIRRYFNFGGAFPFDWWITPAQGLSGVLENFDVEFLYSPNHLELTEGALSVRHKSLGILLHHEFPRLPENPGHPIVPNFLEFMEQPKTRTKYLVNKLLQLNVLGRRIMFIRETLGDKGDDLVRITSSLEKLFSMAEWCFVPIPTMIPADDVYGWRCDPAKWDDELGKLRIKLDRGDDKPFDITTEPGNSLHEK